MIGQAARCRDIPGPAADRLPEGQATRVHEPLSGLVQPGPRGDRAPARMIHGIRVEGVASTARPGDSAPEYLAQRVGARVQGVRSRGQALHAPTVVENAVDHFARAEVIVVARFLDTQARW